MVVNASAPHPHTSEQAAADAFWFNFFFVIIFLSVVTTPVFYYYPRVPYGESRSAERPLLALPTPPPEKV